MAKINHNNVFETIDRVIENAKQHRAIHLYAEGDVLKGDAVTIEGNKLWHFATTGYLGLEQDERLKEAAAEAVGRYGTQFPLSKTYISHPLYAELEEKVAAIYKHPAIIAKNSTLAHIAVIPQAVANDDAVILDHQVHWSVQNACQNLKLRGIPVYMIRHNNMEQLEEYLLKMGNKYRRIWYMADGIYSMYGDYCPVNSLKGLMEKYARLYLYFDDVHGVSWMGDRGSGFVKSHWQQIPQRMILISTLSKTFGASGAVILCGEEQLHRQIKNFGGPLTFSAQLEPAAAAAAIASADIHLSEEIYRHQEKLRSKIKRFRKALQTRGLPLMSSGETPVFYIGTGLPDTAYCLVERLQKEGFFVNPGIYPAVPLRNAGLRITVSNHNADRQIEELAAALEYHLPKALEQTGHSLEKVYRAFGKNGKSGNREQQTQGAFRVNVYETLDKIDAAVWNRYLGQHQALDYDGMRFVERYFSGIAAIDPNSMRFRYYEVTDAAGSVKGLTHTSISLWKEDMLAPVKVSEKIERIRREQPLFLTDFCMGTGSVFTEGMHWYTEVGSGAEQLLLERMEEDFTASDAAKLVLRDFDKGQALSQTALSRGYVVVEMPETAVFSNFDWEDVQGFERILSKRSKRHFREEVLPFVNAYCVEARDKLSAGELPQVYELYLNVKNNNLAVNNFAYNLGLFQAMNESELWRFLLLRDPDNRDIKGVMFCCINHTNGALSPLLAGMTLEENGRLQLYRQLLFQTIKYAKEQGFKRVYLGISAAFEKRKLGAEILNKEAYIQMKDHYASDLLLQWE